MKMNTAMSITGNSSDVAVFSRINFRLLHVEDLAVYTAF